MAIIFIIRNTYAKPYIMGLQEPPQKGSHHDGTRALLTQPIGVFEGQIVAFALTHL
jgi:hypothetical protein